MYLKLGIDNTALTGEPLDKIEKYPKNGEAKLNWIFSINNF